MKKRIISIVGAIAFFISMFILFDGQNAMAALPGGSTATEIENRLITVAGKSVMGDMKIDDIKALFGEPKLTTGSYWGGYAYTFYAENYCNYLYIETYRDGSISAYGSVSKGFQTNKYNYGDKPDNYVHVGCEATDSEGKIFGVIYYTRMHTNAYKIFEKHLVENNRNLAKHSVLMWNAVSYLYGDNTPTYFDEELFELNAQLGDNSSNFYEYCNATSQNSFQLISDSCLFFTEYKYPNPLEIASYATNYNCYGNKAYGGYYYPGKDHESYWKLSGFISEEILSDWSIVQYTEEEKQKLNLARQYYSKSVEEYNSAEDYYEIEPQYTDLSNIVGGKLKRQIAEAAVDYLNAIRVGGSLNALEYSEDLSIGAQAKATYTVALSANNINNPSPHYPPKVEGISDEFYQLCQTGSSENLFMCGFLNTSVIGSITWALDDSYGSGQYYSRGHRLNLLNPYSQYLGVGNCMQQGCHKLSGNQSADVDIVSWPSKGITLEESGFASDGMYTCQFYNGLTPGENTTITIKCLNTEKVWKIDPANLSDGQEFMANGTLLSYRDDSITMKVGGVYEITYDHLVDRDKNVKSYTYRTVYEKGYMSGADASQISLNLENSNMKVGLNATKKLLAQIKPDDMENKRIYFRSSDESVAMVNKCGEISGLTLGECDIIATTEQGSMEAVCHINVVEYDDTVVDDIDDIINDKEDDIDDFIDDFGENGKDDITFTPNEDPSLYVPPTQTEHIIKIGKAKITSAKNSQKRSIVIKWKKVNNAKSYKIQYATNKKFTKAKGKTVKGKLQITLKNLKKGKTYWVRVQGINGKQKGAWSKAKMVKVKK